jgi:hypothetical protein
MGDKDMAKTGKEEQKIPSGSRIGVVGAGTMGSGIALAVLYADLHITLYDVSQEMLDKAKEYTEYHLSRKRKATNIKYVTLTRQLGDLRGSQVVIEAIPEDLDLRRELFSRLDQICPPPAILATNTSTLPVTTLAAEVRRPERVAGAGGWFTFRPAPGMRGLCEESGFSIIETESKTDQDGSKNPGIGIVAAGRSEGMKEYAQKMGQELPADIPILCQPADVMTPEAANWLSHAERLTGFDGLLLANGEIAT